MNTTALCLKSLTKLASTSALEGNERKMQHIFNTIVLFLKKQKTQLFAGCIAMRSCISLRLCKMINSYMTMVKQS